MNKIRFFLSALICMLSLNNAWAESPTDENGNSDGETITITCADENIGTADDGQLTWTHDPFTFVADKGGAASPPAYNVTGMDVRIYAKGTFTVSSKDKILKIVFNLSTQGMKRLAPISANTGKITVQDSGDQTVIWTGNAKEVTFTVGDKADFGTDGSSKAGQLCFTSISATFTTYVAPSIASGTCGDNLAWTLDSDGLLSIEGSGEMYYYDTYPWDSYKSAITSVSIGNGVTSIGRWAFDGCSSLTSVEIPNSVTSIGNNAFYECSGLISVTIPNSITSIESMTFAGCTGLTSVTIPNSVTSIGQKAFYVCSSLSSVTIPNSLTSIGSEAFGYCSSVKELIYADGCTTTFDTGLTSITSVTIPNSMTIVGERAFYGCTGLTSVTIPYSVTSIGNSAFYGCSYLTSVTIPNGVTSIGYQAFRGCSRLTSITIPNGVTRIEDYAFRECSSLKSVTIPNSVTSIGSEAFQWCTRLEIVTNFATTPQQIDSYTFSNYGTLYVPAGSVSEYQSANYWQNFTIQPIIDIVDSGNCGYSLTWTLDSSGLLSIEGNGKMFDYYAEDVPWHSYSSIITSLAIGDNVTRIGNNAFYNCVNLESFHAEGCNVVGMCAFEGCTSLNNVIIPNCTKIEQRGFYDCPLANIEIAPNAIWEETAFGSSVDKETTFFDGDYAFKLFDYFTGHSVAHGVKIVNCASSDLNLVIPNTLSKDDVAYPVIALEDHLFQDSRLESVVLPETMTLIGDGAFEGSLYLKSVNLPESLVVIGTAAFNGCKSLVEVTIPDNVTSIDVLFSDCSNLEKVNISPNSKLSKINNYSFYGCKLKYFYVPKEVVRLDAYDIFGGNQQLEVVEFAPDSKLEYINNCTFAHSLIREIKIPASVEVLDGSFRNCEKLRKVTFEEGSRLKKLGNQEQGTFHNCPLLMEVDLPEGLTTIEGEAFDECPNLSFIHIPASVTELGAYAFNFNNNEALLAFESTDISNFSDYAFDRLNSKVLVKVPEEAFDDWKRKFPNLNYIVANVESITLNNGEDLAVAVNTQKRIKAVVLPENAVDRVVWSSSDETVATVDQDGVVTGVGKGNAVVTATAVDGTGITATCNVVVDYIYMTDIYFDREQYELRKGNNYNLQITTVPENASNRGYVLRSSNNDVALVSNDGLLIANGCGEAIITAVSEDGHTTATTKVIVKDFAAAVWYVEDSNENGFVAFRDKYTTLFMNNGDNLSLADIDERLKSSEWIVKRTDTGEQVSIVEEGVDYRISNRQTGYIWAINGNNLFLVPSEWEDWNVDVRFVSAGNDAYYIAVNGLLIQQETNMYQDLGFYNQDGMTDTWRYRATNSMNNPTSLEIELTEYRKDEGSVRIPAHININDTDYEVTKLGNSLFSNKTLTSSYIPASVRVIGDDCFLNSQTLQSVNFEEGSLLTEIGESAFLETRNLKSFNIPETISRIKPRAFLHSGIEHYDFPENAPLKVIEYETFWNSQIQSIKLPAAVETIEGHAFAESGIQTITLPENTHLRQIDSEAFANSSAFIGMELPSTLEVIGNNAFINCQSATFTFNAENSNLCDIGSNVFTRTKLTELHIPHSVNHIGSNAFSETFALIHFDTEQPIALGSPELLGEDAYAVVPRDYVETYRNADQWRDFKDQILSEEDYDRSVTINADPSASALEQEIGRGNMRYVGKLKINGTINGYDIMELRNQFIALRQLDLSDATVVANDNGWEYYQGQHVEDNVLNGHSFSNRLLSIVLPKTLVRIGGSAFEECGNLTSVVFGDDIKEIDAWAFGNCPLETIELPKNIEYIGDAAFTRTHVKSINFPASLIEIGGHAFQDNIALERIEFSGNNLKRIEDGAFSNCRSLNNVVLPNRLEYIGNEAFNSCYFTEFRIPSSVKEIGDNAFRECSRLMDVYAYVIDPIQINQNTFWNWTKATLHIPEQTENKYHLNTQWNQFINQTTFNEDYDYFYLQQNSDVNLKEEIAGKPDLDLNTGSGLVVEKDVEQKVDDLTVEVENGDSGAIIGDVTANSAKFNIHVEEGRWYFLAFPFPVSLSSLNTNGEIAVRRYNGELRASTGTGWEDVTDDVLNVGEGYIIQCENSGVLSVPIEQPRFTNVTKMFNLMQHSADNPLNASWNLMGNPNLAYYSINDLGYDAPITVWTGDNYRTVRPGDDIYIIKPFEAYFVQKPNGVDQMRYLFDMNTTYLEALQKAKQQGNVMRKAPVNPDRLIVNIEVSDGEKSDMTRVAFSEKRTMDYEIGEDAAKFTASVVPQIYSVHNGARYSINERPMGSGVVNLGFIASKAGTYSIGISRMDVAMLLKDNVTGAVYDFVNGEYEFESEAGTFENRFSLVIDNTADGIGAIYANTGVSITANDGGLNIIGADNANVSVYTTGGAMVANNPSDGQLSLSNGVYLVKVDGMTAKVVVK